jgi:predicted methyltransferase
MPAFRSVLALALLALPAPALAKPSDYAAAVADSAREAKDRAQDPSRMPAEILDFAAVSHGQVVADFMAGNGYFSEMIARAVGPRGTVYVLNPPNFHDGKVWDKVAARRPNIRTLAVPIAQMQLAPASIDTMFTHLVFHDLYWESEKFKFPRNDVPAVLADWFRAVKPGGHVVVIDHVGPAGDPRDVVERLHRIDPAQVKADMAAAGFVLVGESSVLQRSDDAHDKNVFDPAIRGKTDRFMLKFRRP